MKLTVDPTICQGYGLCADEAPELVELDDAGYATIIGDGEVGDELQSAAEFLAAQADSSDDISGCSCSLGIVGPPDCATRNQPCDTAWTPAKYSGSVAGSTAPTQYIDVQFARAVYVSQVEIVVPYGGRTLERVYAF